VSKFYIQVKIIALKAAKAVVDRFKDYVDSRLDALIKDEKADLKKQ
jgi:hypothetical protein